jgi:hypothetical protein
MRLIFPGAAGSRGHRSSTRGNVHAQNGLEHGSGRRSTAEGGDTAHAATPEDRPRSPVGLGQHAQPARLEQAGQRSPAPRRAIGRPRRTPPPDRRPPGESLVEGAQGQVALADAGRAFDQRPAPGPPIRRAISPGVADHSRDSGRSTVKRAPIGTAADHPPSRAILGRMVAAVRLDDLAGDRQAQARIAAERLALGPRGVEALEDGLQIFGRDARAVVVDRDDQPVVMVARPDRAG